MIKFAFILALVMPDGKLEMYGEYVDACPLKSAFTQNMDERQAKGEFRAWNAICVDLSKEGQKT